MEHADSSRALRHRSIEARASREEPSESELPTRISFVEEAHECEITQIDEAPHSREEDTQKTVRLNCRSRLRIFQYVR